MSIAPALMAAILNLRSKFLQFSSRFCASESNAVILSKHLMTQFLSCGEKCAGSRVDADADWIAATVCAAGSADASAMMTAVITLRALPDVERDEDIVEALPCFHTGGVCSRMERPGALSFAMLRERCAGCQCLTAFPWKGSSA